MSKLFFVLLIVIILSPIKIDNRTTYINEYLIEIDKRLKLFSKQMNESSPTIEEASKAMFECFKVIRGKYE